jgi:hypothetical protein
MFFFPQKLKETTTVTMEEEKKKANRLQLNENSIIHTITLEISPHIFDHILHHMHINTYHIGGHILLLSLRLCEGRHQLPPPTIPLPHLLPSDPKLQQQQQQQSNKPQQAT